MKHAVSLPRTAPPAVDNSEEISRIAAEHLDLEKVHQERHGNCGGHVHVCVCVFLHPQCFGFLVNY